MDLIRLNRTVSFPEPQTVTTEYGKKVEFTTLGHWRREAENLEEADRIISLMIDCCNNRSTELCLNNVYSITRFPPIPPHVLSLKVSGWTALKKLSDNLPPKLVSLEVFLCNALEELSDDLPSKLVNLKVTGCDALKKLPDTFPVTLKKLVVIECNKLTTVPNFPSLNELVISWCRAVEALPPLPLTLTIFDISGLRALIKVPNLPKELKQFNVENCSALTEPPEDLPPEFRSLILAECLKLHKFNRST